MNSHNPLLSVIVPVFNTEKYLRKCIESIINQSYKNIEIIIVDDCSPGEAKEISNEYILLDSRIKYIRHDKNKGLFAARVTGSDRAIGDFISFVDSDDYVSVDFFRLLINKALEESADIVEGRFVRENEDGSKFIQNNNNLLLDSLCGDEIRDEFFNQEGLFYHWHVIWNKIYKKSLWDKCLPYYKKQKEHLIMTEDLVFSSLLFCNAEKYCSIKYEGYFYLIRDEASTGAHSDAKKFIKNIKDMGIAFDFVETYLKTSKKYGKYAANIIKWKNRYYRLWYDRIKSAPLSITNKNHVLNELKTTFKSIEREPVQPSDHFHAFINTPWDGRYEDLKKKISDKSIRYISFDVFDTLIVRPFLDPRDILVFLDNYYHELCNDSSILEFSTVRMLAEDQSRQRVSTKYPSWQDTNLDEIYDFIEKEYKIPYEILSKLKAKEIELEYEFTYRRESVYELYEMARTFDKKIILVSDMYLPGSVVQKIVEQAGYKNHLKLYISSETRVLKNTGDMFNYVIDDLGIQPEEILHIGDNWNSDKIMAEKAGWNSFYIPKTTDLLINNLSDKETGRSFKYFGELNPNKWKNNEYSELFLGTRCMLALVANKIFDNPFKSFHPDSDFNADPYFIGYYALGMHTFSLCKWILEDAVQKQYDTLHFMARDGYLPKKVYDICSQIYETAPKSKYLYASRRSLLPLLLNSYSKYGLDSLISINAHTPKSVITLFDRVLKEEIDFNNIEQSGVILSKPFNSSYELKKFIDILMKECIDEKKLKNYCSNTVEYFKKEIKSNDATFDLGYSARLQTIINSSLEQQINTYFVHTSGEVPWLYANRNNFTIESYYELKPRISGIFREHLFAELGPSCVGYERDQQGSVIPFFEEYRSNHINDLVIRIIQSACIDFSKDMLTFFRQYLPSMKFRAEESSIPLEMMIHSSSAIDRTLFKFSYSDDTVHAGNGANNVLFWWDQQINRINKCTSLQENNRSLSSYDFLFGHGRFSKAIFYYLFDRDTLKTKFKNRYQSKKIVYRPILFSYRLVRKIKRLVTDRK